VGNLPWLAPEILLQLPYDHRVDTYSFGILLIEIFTRISPYSDMPEYANERNEWKNLGEDLIQDILEKGLRPNFSKTPKTLQSLIRTLLNENPKDRFLFFIF
jgi:serine/threonine protein kinase